ncbi:UNVERIFIED_CONTAM: hypothetical protein Slati_0458800 [Sesamum latifolium]|uniref:Uncharacterized protein n=1 Tax=Sesamum latifolium TaxID=2727402 RepID=A0AAW2XWZ7_9LAMI
MSLAPTTGGSAPTSLAPAPPPQDLQVLWPTPPTQPSSGELSPVLLGDIQRLVSAAIREHMSALALARIATTSDVDASEEEAEGNVPVPVPPMAGR